MTDENKNDQRFADEEAERLRKRYKYRKLVQSGKLVLPYKDATSLLGPDTAYHLYAVKAYTTGEEHTISDNRSLLTPRFEKALVFTHRHHLLQKRKKTKIPYISHLLCVASVVLENGGDEDMAIAGLLHDAIEDCPDSVTPAKIRSEINKKFGEKVLTIVESCTDTDETPKPPWMERKKKFIETLPTLSREAWSIIAADKLCNVRSLILSYRKSGEGVWKRFSGTKDQILWYYRSVTDALRQSLPGDLVETLNSTVAEMECLVKR